MVIINAVILFVCLDLIICGLDIGIFINGILELNDNQRDAVDKEHNIRALVIVILDNGKLINRKKFVVFGIGKINQPNFIIW